MLFYPQLLTGAVCQYPVTRKNNRRTLTNILADGTTIRMADTGAASVNWELGYSNLTTTEAAGLQDLFTASFGEWGSFTFLDPTDNLLNWSEDLTHTVWAADPLLALGAGLTDPFGGTAATRLTNASQTTQQLAQSLAAPGWYQYCFSVYVRSDQPTQVELFASNGGESAQTDLLVGAEWQRAVYSFQLASIVPTIAVGVRLPAGASVSVFGLQLDAQLGPGSYMKSRDRAGLYPKTRFQGGTLRPTATGLNQFACAVTLVASVAG